MNHHNPPPPVEDVGGLVNDGHWLFTLIYFGVGIGALFLLVIAIIELVS